MDRVRLVAFYVFCGDDGVRLEVSGRTDGRQFLHCDYESLTVSELLCVVEATLDTVRPGDLVGDHGEVMPPLWR